MLLRSLIINIGSGSGYASPSLIINHRFRFCVCFSGFNNKQQVLSVIYSTIGLGFMYPSQCYIFNHRFRFYVSFSMIYIQPQVQVSCILLNDIFNHRFRFHVYLLNVLFSTTGSGFMYPSQYFIFNHRFRFHVYLLNDIYSTIGLGFMYPSQ